LRNGASHSISIGARLARTFGHRLLLHRSLPRVIFTP
jgi:hypothetical protein